MEYKRKTGIISKQIDVSAALIIQDNRILLTRRKPGESQAGYWEFPGGKLEDTETAQQCLERELVEELNLETSASDIFTSSIYQYPGGKQVHLIAIFATILSGEIRLKVHDRYAWVPIAELLNYSLAPADIPIAKELQTYFTSSEERDRKSKC